MGEYLTKPDTEKHTEQGEAPQVRKHIFYDILIYKF